MQRCTHVPQASDGRMYRPRRPRASALWLKLVFDFICVHSPTKVSPTQVSRTLTPREHLSQPRLQARCRIDRYAELLQLRFGVFMVLPRRFAKPFDALVAVLRHASALHEHPANIVLRGRVPLLCGAQESVEPLRRVLRQAAQPVEIEPTDAKVAPWIRHRGGELAPFARCGIVALHREFAVYQRANHSLLRIVAPKPRSALVICPCVRHGAALLVQSGAVGPAFVVLRIERDSARCRSQRLFEKPVITLHRAAMAPPRRAVVHLGCLYRV